MRNGDRQATWNNDRPPEIARRQKGRIREADLASSQEPNGYLVALLASGKMREDSFARLQTICAGIIVRRNIGYCLERRAERHVNCCVALSFDKLDSHASLNRLSRVRR